MVPLFRGDLYHPAPASVSAGRPPVDALPPMRHHPYEGVDQWRRQRPRTVIPESPSGHDVFVNERQRWAARPPVDPHNFRSFDRPESEDDEAVSYDGPDDDRTLEPMRSSSSSSSGSKKRSRRMSNSERGKLYRSRRKEYVDSLEQTVATLKREIESLRVASTTQSGVSHNGPASNTTPSTLWIPRDRTPAALARVVCEYFSLFEFGVPVAARDAPVSSDALARSARQVEFLHSQVRPDMRFGDKYGIPMLLEQWERYSLYHGSLQFTLSSLAVDRNSTDCTTTRSPPVSGTGAATGTRNAPATEADSIAVVSANATLRVRLTRRTIEQVFPHVLWNEPLVQKLIGREIEYPVSNRFYFGDDGKITQYETEVDFVGAFIRALGDEHEASQLVGHALIKSQAMIGPLEEDDANARPTAPAVVDNGSEQVRMPAVAERLKPSTPEAYAPFERAEQHERYGYRGESAPTRMTVASRYPRYDSLPRPREYEARVSTSYVGCESFV
ncbi:hypothetical protein PINS_up005982 [Pythium insidiosum]|nr:hypothetical protein PINS_up005982 [Pythium insidiosum]